MLKNITLDRPLAVLDLETTGIDPKLDRIIEVSVLKLLRGKADRYVDLDVMLDNSAGEEAA